MITLGVRDLQKSIGFYKDGLGLPMMKSPPGTAFFNLNGSWLGLSPIKHQAEEIGVELTETRFSGINLVHNVTSEDEVIQLTNKFYELGGQIIKAPIRADWGGFHAYCKDLDEHIWEIAHNPFFWVGPTSE